MAYTVTIRSSRGDEATFTCGGLSDQEALVYAGKVVEQTADPADPDASVIIKNDDKEIGVPTTVRDMLGSSAQQKP